MTTRTETTRRPALRGSVAPRASASPTPVIAADVAEAVHVVAAALVASGPLQDPMAVGAALRFVQTWLGGPHAAEQLADDRSDPALGERLHAALTGLAASDQADVLGRLLREARTISDQSRTTTRGQESVLEDIAAALVS